MPHGGADNTQKILDVLADYGVKATFFVVGNWADQYPEQAKAIVESGNELMNHSNASFNSFYRFEILYLLAFYIDAAICRRMQAI